MPIQQHAPIASGLPPVFMSFTISVLNPIAAIARTMKNLLTSFIGLKKSPETPRLIETVVITEAAMK